MRVAVFCVGNRLHQDDGVGPAVYDAIMRDYRVPDNVVFLDVGVMTMDLVNYVDTCDAIVAVDAVENTGLPVGTVVRFKPEEVKRTQGYAMSLHDLKLADLFDMAHLVGYEAEGICLGMQVAETEPAYLTEALSPEVQAALPKLVDALVAELSRLGVTLQRI